MTTLFNLKKRNCVDHYLNELIDYGGLLCTRGEAIADMQSMGHEQGCIDRWLQGQELAQRLRERRSAINLKLYLA